MLIAMTHYSSFSFGEGFAATFSFLLRSNLCGTHSLSNNDATCNNSTSVLDSYDLGSVLKLERCSTYRIVLFTHPPRPPRVQYSGKFSGGYGNIFVVFLFEEKPRIYYPSTKERANHAHYYGHTWRIPDI